MTEQQPDKDLMANAVAVYLSLRKQKSELEAKHKEELAPIKQRMSDAEDLFLSVLNSMGAQSIKTAAGTPYKKDVTSLKIQDWDVCLAYIQRMEAWELLKKDLTKTAVLERLEAEDPVPGVTVSTFTKVYVQSK